MPIFNFKKFNESNSNSSSLTEEHLEILQEIIEDLWTMEFESLPESPFKNRIKEPPKLKFGNICLRTSDTYSPGTIATLVDMQKNSLPKSNIFGFSIRKSKILDDKILKRALSLFEHQTKISLSDYTNDERQTIIAEKKVIEFINKVIDFECNLPEAYYMLPNKYQQEVEILIDDVDLQVEISFLPKHYKSRIIGCYLDCRLSRGVVIGGDLLINDEVEYKFKIGNLWNFQEERDPISIKQFAEKNKGKEYQFKFDVYYHDESYEELSDFFQNEILSKIELPSISFKNQVESELNKLKQWSIKSQFEYQNDEIIEVNLDWKGDEYQFYLYLNKMYEQDSKNLISIKQADNWIDKSSIEDLAETIYLLLTDGKLKIS